MPHADAGGPSRLEWFQTRQALYNVFPDRRRALRLRDLLGTERPAREGPASCSTRPRRPADDPRSRRGPFRPWAPGVFVTSWPAPRRGRRLLQLVPADLSDAGSNRVRRLPKGGDAFNQTWMSSSGPQAPTGALRARCRRTLGGPIQTTVTTWNAQPTLHHHDAGRHPARLLGAGGDFLSWETPPARPAAPNVQLFNQPTASDTPPPQSAPSPMAVGSQTPTMLPTRSPPADLLQPEAPPPTPANPRGPISRRRVIPLDWLDRHKEECSPACTEPGRRSLPVPDFRTAAYSYHAAPARGSCA